MNRLFLLLSRYWALLLFMNLCILGAAIAAKSLTSSETWTASAKLILPNTGANITANLGTLGSLENTDPSFSNQINPLKLQTSILQSDFVMGRLLADDPESQQVAKLSKYKQLFDVSIVEQAPIIRITVEGSTPAIAQGRLDRLIETYQRRLNELRQTNSSAREQPNRQKLEQAQSQLIQAQRRLAEFQESSGLVNPDEQTKNLVGAISELQNQYVTLQAEAMANWNEVKVLSNRLGLTPAQAIQALALEQNQGYGQIRQKLTEVSIALADASSRYTPSHPTVRQLSRQYDNLLNELRQYVGAASIRSLAVNTDVTSGAEGRSDLIQQMILSESHATSRQQQAERIAREVNVRNIALESIPKARIQLMELQRASDIAEGVYKGLVTQAQESNLDAFNAYPNVQILDPPKVDPDASEPGLKLALINALLAIVVADLALILFLEKRNPLLYPNDLKRQKFAFIHSIPFLKRGRHKGISHAANFSNEFNLLASTCTSTIQEDRFILITSASPADGKTFVMLGLARALRSLGLRVLIADSHDHSSLIQHFFHASPHQDAEEFGISYTELESNLGLALISDKAMNEPKFFAKGEFKDRLNQLRLKHQYDYILVDTPPFDSSSRAALLSKFFQNILFVIRPGFSKRENVLQALQYINQNGVDVLGLVINGEGRRSEIESEFEAKPNG